MKVKPLGERLLVLREEAEEKSTGGILLTHSHQEKPNQGEVKAIGDDVTTVKVGDTVVFGKYSGSESLDVDNETLLILELKDVKAVIYE
jgi:chaperonin GroES